MAQQRLDPGRQLVRRRVDRKVNLEAPNLLRGQDSGDLASAVNCRWRGAEVVVAVHGGDEGDAAAHEPLPTSEVSGGAG